MNWLKYKKIYFAISGVLILVSIYAIFILGYKLGVDFTGGTLWEITASNQDKVEKVEEIFEDKQIAISSISQNGEDVLIKFAPTDKEKINDLRENLTEDLDNFTELRLELVGPAIGPELIKKTVYAILIASIVILLWVAYQFKSVKYGVSAILAMFHDTFILVGLYIFTSHFTGYEIDFLFVTALLTTLSFSVHDTIVVFDRIREISKKEGGELGEVSNRALTETMVRSLNNSFTIMFMLIALLLLGGNTIKAFALALLIGTILGTYSSPFVAVPLLNIWDDMVGVLRDKIRK